ncbi:hypothetical protein [Nonomuraea cavernae]|uniref:hypothetical protein n=1 Tax=Nonomuraea cavernae TaxID=2045107 RepID=UPI00166B40A8|nr:hypothetical protein [Nonomuraea cavernae]MCA2186747.1 hypothetical protein [Nonomuraea cavernae]
MNTGENAVAEMRAGSSGTGAAMPSQQAGISTTPSGGQPLVMPQAQQQPVDAAPQPFVAALESSGSAELGAPLPRQIAVSTRRAQRLEPANPLAGARGAPAVAGGIAVLLGGLWVVAWKQRARIRKMEQ